MSKHNPYKVGTLKDTQVATTMRMPFKNSREALVANNGDINAGSVKELFQVMSKLMETAAANGIYTESQAVEKEATAKAHREMLLAAFGDRSGSVLAEVGNEIADSLYLTANRDGFMRRLMAYQELSRGTQPTARMRTKRVLAVVASGPAQVATQLVSDNSYYPDEFTISVRPFVAARDIERTNGDILQEKFIESLEGTMVAEDRTWKAMADATVGIENSLTTFGSAMNPTTLSAFKNKVTQWNLPAKYWLIANNIWDDIIGDSGFQNLIDPVSKHELLMSGQLGTILGMDIITDAYRHQEHKVLAAGEQYIIGAPESHGQYTDRGGIKSEVISGVQEGIAGNGWFIYELMSMIITNPRSVAKGYRV